MTDYGLVSIITPNYNCAKFIAQTIESVQSQTYKNWEMLIQDDCSSDESVSIANQYAKSDPRIKIAVNNHNSGAAVSRNNALARAKGEWIAFLDSDDLWNPEKLLSQLQWMVENNCDFSFMEYEHIDESGKPMLVKARTIKKLTYGRMLWHCWTGCLTVMYRNNCKVEGPDVKNCNDYALFLKVLKTKKNALGMPLCSAFYRIRNKSISRNKWKKLKPYLEVMHGAEKKSLFVSYIYLISNQIVKVLFKYKHISESKMNKILYINDLGGG